MNNITHVALEERTFSTVRDGLGKKMMLIREWRLIEWMMNAVSIFCKAGELVLDIGVRTLEDCEGVFATTIAQQVCSFWEGPYVLSRWADIDYLGIRKARFESRVGDSWRRENCWTKKGLRERNGSACIKEKVQFLDCADQDFPLETFPVHIMDFLGDVYDQATLLEMCQT